jgi:adenylyltransferase/sulfurtransferase
LDALETFQVDIPSEGRFTRHEAIGWWEQARLACARVLVVGAGALGNEVLKNLALVGVGHLTVVDMDTVAPSNLSRSVLFREPDVGRPKARVAAERLSDLHPSIRVTAREGALADVLPVGLVARHDLVIGCLDSLEARLDLDDLAHRAGVPWINGGLGVSAGEVAHLDPTAGKACFTCTVSSAARGRRARRFSCQGLRRDLPEEAVPTTATMASMVAALQVHQALLVLHGRTGEYLAPGEKHYLALTPWTSLKMPLQRQAECPVHERATTRSLPVAYRPNITLGELWPQLEARTPVMWLRRRWLLEVRCPACETVEAIERPVASVREQALACPDCATVRIPTILDRLTPASTDPSWTLERLGILGEDALPCQDGDTWKAIAFRPERSTP